MKGVEKILEKEGIRDFKKDIRTMSKKELRKYFCFKTRRKINPTKLIKNLIWQGYTWIRDDKMEPIEGNLRSFWYQNVKSALSRVVGDVGGRRYMAKVYNCFVEMITVHNLFRYADFGFDDDGEGARIIGKLNGNLILFVEKKGLKGIVRRIAKASDATGVASDGFPSYLATEYLVREMASLGLLFKPVHLFFILDYDPAGYWIGQEFVEQLESYKVKIASVHDLIVPTKLSKEKLEDYKYKLKSDARTKNWLESTGGIYGEAYGLEADIFGGSGIRKLCKEAMKPYLGKVSLAEATMPPSNAAERKGWIGWLAAEPVWRK